MLQLLLLLDHLQLRYLSTDALVCTFCFVSDAIEVNLTVRRQAKFSFDRAAPTNLLALLLQKLFHVHFNIVGFYNR